MTGTSTEWAGKIVLPQSRCKITQLDSRMILWNGCARSRVGFRFQYSAPSPNAHPDPHRMPAIKFRVPNFYVVESVNPTLEIGPAFGVLQYALGAALSKLANAHT